MPRRQARSTCDLIFWPPERELSASEVVDHALTYRPITLFAP